MPEAIDPAVPEAERPERRSLIPKSAWTVVRLLISILLLGWILKKTDIASIQEALLNADVLFVGLALGSNLVGLMISALRWRLLLNACGSEAKVSFLVVSYLISMFFNNLLPSTIGGDVHRTYDSWKLGQSKSGALAIVLTDRLLGLFALLLFALMALILPNVIGQSIPFLWVWVTLAIAALSSLLFALIFMPMQRLLSGMNPRIPFLSSVGRILQAFSLFRNRRRVLASAFALSLLLQANVVLHYYLVMRALAVPMSFHSLFIVVPLVTVVLMVPISINGIGLREHALALFLAPFGIGFVQSVAVAWGLYGLVLVQGIVGGILYVVRR